MSVEFSTAISALRREKGISQKDAAKELGVSQALLSHYEKGIRECRLDFVKKAAKYYGVSTDYLLGLSPSRHSSTGSFAVEDGDGDVFGIDTLLNCILYISEKSENEGRKSSENFIEFLSLALGKYIELKEKTDNKLPLLFDYAQNSMAGTTLPFAVSETLPDEVKKVKEMAREFISCELG